MTNHRRTTVYIGVTNDLVRRVWQHQHGELQGFTKDYRLTLLVYYEVCPEPRAALAREKQLKGWRRTRKDALINTMNPECRDLSGELFQAPTDHRGPSTPLHSAQDDSGMESVN